MADIGVPSFLVNFRCFWRSFVVFVVFIKKHKIILSMLLHFLGAQKFRLKVTFISLPAAFSFLKSNPRFRQFGTGLNNC
ncbi:hypothetical protein L1887_09331 [Cichorium endivia]|nr:hypothetical protein L1887_09331 [Cichorium endivia]